MSEICEGCENRGCELFGCALKGTSENHQVKAKRILAFLEGIGGAGYGGMADYEIALDDARSLSHMDAK